MGNCCGKPDSENFSSPGRVVGSAPPQPQRASVPPSKVVGGPPRTLGGGQDPSAAQSSGADEARQRAAEAAEVRLTHTPFSPSPERLDLGLVSEEEEEELKLKGARAKTAQKSTGKLGSQLNAQKKQTRQDTLKEVSANEIRARDANEAAQARSYN
ncbi:hypothetical protein BJ170DRAFT_677859 [Xylariales sp. AK1849]|nr:hypothetical protein BJ170DRAFT_677859 [Xylariales sp. AK1849]